MKISLEEFARIVYLDNERLDASVLTSLRDVLGKDEVESIADMRAVAMALDRSWFPTPIIVRFSPEDIRFASINGIACPVDRHDQGVSVPSAAGRAYEPHLVACFKRICKPGAVALDIGANIGYHTLMLASLVGNEGKCYAFEPNSENCRMILIGCDHNKLTNVTLVPTGLSDRAGWAYFSTHIGSNGGVVTEQYVALHGNGGIVPMQTLDSFGLRHADVIKIDIEGGEYKALKGGGALLASSRPAIVSEFSAEMTIRVSGVSASDYLDWIASMNYKIFLLDNKTSEAVPVESVASLLSNWGSNVRIEDFLFIPLEKAAQLGFA